VSEKLLSGEIEGYLIVWGSPDNLDLQGEYFCKTTKLNIGDDIPIEATIDGDMEIIGTVTDTLVDDKGVFIKGKVDVINPLIESILRLLGKRILFLAPGGHWFSDDNGYIEEMDITEALITSNPAQPPTHWVNKKEDSDSV
jgi:hypothetical protein